MVWEDGVNWVPLDPHARGRHRIFKSAVDQVAEAMMADLRGNTDPFFKHVTTSWENLFPTLAARPAYYDASSGVLCLSVSSVQQTFTVRNHLPAVKRALKKLPGAPRNLIVRMETRR